MKTPKDTDQVRTYNPCKCGKQKENCEKCKTTINNSNECKDCNCNKS